MSTATAADGRASGWRRQLLAAAAAAIRHAVDWARALPARRVSRQLPPMPAPQPLHRLGELKSADRRSTLTIVSLPVAERPAAPPNPPLSPAREALRQAIAAHRAALHRLDEAHVPLQRLQAVTDELAQIERQLADIDREHQATIGEWLAAGSPGERPQPAAARVGLGQWHDELLADAMAAGIAMPDAQRRHQEAAQAAAAAARRRDEALVIAAVDAAHQIAETELVAAVEGVLRIEARICGLGAALMERAAGARFAAPRRRGLPADRGTGCRSEAASGGATGQRWWPAVSRPAGD